MGKLSTVSLCMIVKNEEKTLERCLASASGVADEIIVADTGSTDRTKEIASAFTRKVFDYPWRDDFSAARNFSFRHAAMDYCLWLDADDILLPVDAVKLKRLKETLPTDVDAVMMRYDTGFDEEGKVAFSCYRERLCKTSRRFQWQEPVHEYLAVTGKTIRADIHITHAKPRSARTDRNIRIYEALLAAGETLTPRGMYYYARELLDHRLTADGALWLRRFLDTGLGWVEDNIAASGALARCLLAEGKGGEALSALLGSFAFDTPRAELCCQIGAYFKALGQYRLAAFWYELVLGLDSPKDSLGFRQEDCWGYIPLLELALCYDKLGQYEKAAAYNDRAALVKPGASAVLRNKAYFARRLSKGGA